MGTNFYIRQKLSEQQKQEAVRYINENNITEAKKILNSVPDIHIGKRSAGWKFLFNANNFKYFDPNVESLITFLKQNDIVDEYGSHYTFDEFWNNEIPLDNNLLDIEKYYMSDKFKNEYRYQYREELYIIDRFKKEWNIDVNIWGEFYIGDLRFTTCTEFC